MGRTTQVRKHGRRIRRGVTTVTEHLRTLSRGRKAAVVGGVAGAVVDGIAELAIRKERAKRSIRGKYGKDLKDIKIRFAGRGLGRFMWFWTAKLKDKKIEGTGGFTWIGGMIQPYVD